MGLLDEFLGDLDDSEFDEEPVKLDVFLYDKNFMGLKHLSPIQYEIVARGSQVYKEHTLKKLYGEHEGLDIFKNKTTRFLLLMLGKGSGKDFVSQLICCYAVYKLMCLKDPAEYFGKPAGDSIDIVNMAINAKQAKRVFFDGLVTRIKRAPWFAGKFHPKMDEIQFDKNITVYSLHSSYEAAEGLNIIIAVLDEIDGFEIDGQADAIYKALAGTVSSRFSDVGKVICLSFPRSKDGFMMRQYNEAVLPEAKDVVVFEHTFKLNSELPDGEEGNEFSITWEEEIVHGYKFDNFFALKAPTFRVHPDKNIDEYMMDFYKDEEDTLMRVCANPPESGSNSFFKNHEKLHRIFKEENKNGYRDGEIKTEPDPTKNYYIHIDLSKVHDRTVVALGHVRGWEQVQMGTLQTEPAPFIEVDLLRVWEPTKANPVDHNEVMQFILELCRKFRVQLVTFDQWGSANMIEYLTGVGIRAEKKSLARPEYQEFGLVVGDERLAGPYDERLLDELKHLVILQDGKVDHPKKNHNDISEAICGVIRNCVENEVQDNQFRVVTLDTLKRDIRLQAEQQSDNVKDKPQMPNAINEWLNQFKAL